jgi:L-fucose mutarotase/ribose pyranase (RbsD/FucU family)
MGDIVTQLQEQILALAAKFYNVIGTLQRDAPPVAINDEEAHVGSAEAPQNVDEMVQLMAADLLTSFKAVDQTIQLLPSDDRTPEEHMAAIVQLQQENERMAEVLQQEIAQATHVLRCVHGMHRCFAEDALKASE